MASSKIRIVHLATRLIYAGMGQVIAHLLRGLPRHTYETELWCLEEADSLGRRLKADGHTVVELDRRWRRDFRLILRIARRLRENKIRILHCHDELSWFYGTLASLLSPGTRVIVTMHGRRPAILRRHLNEQRILALATRRIISVSAYLQQQLMDELRLEGEKVTTIYNGIPIPDRSLESADRIRARQQLNLPENGLVVGSAGRLAEVKNYPLLIEAASDLAPEIPGLKIVLIGEGPCREQLLRQVAHLGLESTVKFTGMIRNVPDVLSALDIYACTSDYEGISLSILEAMAAERPVIATAVGGNTEIIRHNETGFLIGKGNRNALGRAVRELYHDEGKRRLIGGRALREVERSFSLPRMIRDYDRIYQLTLDGGWIGECGSLPQRMNQ